jgi:hypothetical protein
VKVGLRKVDFVCLPSEVHRKKTDNFQVRLRKTHLVVGNKKVGLVLYKVLCLSIRNLFIILNEASW